MFVKAGQGSGKSYATREHLMKPIAMKPEGKILEVCPRRALALEAVWQLGKIGIYMTSHLWAEPPEGWQEDFRSRKKRRLDSDQLTLTNNLEFCHGLEEHRALYEEKLRNPERYVTSVESLEKSDVEEYDLVYLDEVTQIDAEFTASHLKGRQAEYYYSRLGKACANSEFVMSTDADLDKAIVKRVRVMSGDFSNVVNVYYINSALRRGLYLVSTSLELLNRVLRSLIVERSRVAVACSTKNGPGEVFEHVQKYIFGSLDLFGNPCKREHTQVVQEVALIHPFQEREAIKFLQEILNGALLLSNREEEGMNDRKEQVFTRGVIERCKPREIWELRGNNWVRPQDHPQKEWETKLLAFSPLLSVGNSFETNHFGCMFGYFTHVTCDAETLVQMLTRLRKLLNSVVFLGSGVAEREFSKRYEEACTATKRHCGDEAVKPAEAILSIYEEKSKKRERQKGKAGLLYAAKEALQNSNPFSTIVKGLDEENTQKKGKSKSQAKKENDHKMLKAMVEAKNISERDYQMKNGTEPELARFWRLDQLGLSENEHLDGCDGTKVSKYVLSNYHRPQNADMEELRIVLAILGFGTVLKFAEWTTTASKGGRGNNNLTIDASMWKDLEKQGFNTGDVKEVFDYLRKGFAKHGHALVMKKERKKCFRGKQYRVHHFDMELVCFGEDFFDNHLDDSQTRSLFARIEKLHSEDAVPESTSPAAAPAQTADSKLHNFLLASIVESLERESKRLSYYK